MVVKHKYWYLIAISIVLFMAIATYITAVIIDFNKPLDEVRRPQIRRAVYEIDHVQILKDCREVIKAHLTGKWNKKNYVFDIDAELQNLPKSLIEIGYGNIYITDDSILINCGIRLGLVALSKDAIPSKTSFSCHLNRELIPGLYYYDFWYDEIDNYDEYIDSLNPDLGAN